MVHLIVIIINWQVTRTTPAPGLLILSSIMIIFPKLFAVVSKTSQSVYIYTNPTQKSYRRAVCFTNLQMIVPLCYMNVSVTLPNLNFNVVCPLFLILPHNKIDCCRPMETTKKSYLLYTSNTIMITVEQEKRFFYKDIKRFNVPNNNVHFNCSLSVYINTI